MYNILSKTIKKLQGGILWGKIVKNSMKVYLEQNGIDAEEVKEEYVDNGGHYDIYNGSTVTIESKDGRDVIDTGMSKEEFFKTYGKNKEEEK